jgi:hypothetical protein
MLRRIALMVICIGCLASCSALILQGADPAIVIPGVSLPDRPEYYLGKTYSSEQIDENRRLTLSALAYEMGKTYVDVETDASWPSWGDDTLVINYRSTRWLDSSGQGLGMSYEKHSGAINIYDDKKVFREDLETGFFVSDKKIPISGGSGYEQVTEDRGNPDGSMTSVTYEYNSDGDKYVVYAETTVVIVNKAIKKIFFKLNNKSEWTVLSVEDIEVLPDGSLRDTLTPYSKILYTTEKPTTRYMVSVNYADLVALEPLVKAREAQRKQESEQDKQARSDARWATFGAVVQGLGQAASEVAVEQNAELARSKDLNNTLTQITRDAARKRQSELAAEQQAQASTHAAQQQAGREAAARQLAAANSYRTQQAAQTSDPTTLRRLQADNEKAWRAARQLGVEQQVRNQTVALQHKAVPPSAQAQRGIAQSVVTRDQVPGSEVIPRQPITSRNIVVQQSLPEEMNKLSASPRSSENSALPSTAVQYQTAAMAWCYRKPTSGAFLCSGPLQMMTIVGESDLSYALKLAGCPGGEGKVPGIGTSEKFNCGRMLSPIERRVGEQSPYPE